MDDGVDQYRFWHCVTNCLKQYVIYIFSYLLFLQYLTLFYWPVSNRQHEAVNLPVLLSHPLSRLGEYRAVQAHALECGARG